MKTERSLKSRALQLLSQRDQSRLELRRKLLRHAVRERAARRERSASLSGVAGEDDDDSDPSAAAVEVDTLLTWLEANGFLSDARFAESRIHARAARFGNLRIRGELAQHGVAASAGAVETLSASEPARAEVVRERRFGPPPESTAERAAQSRFLVARGFSPEVIHRLMRRRARADSEA